MITLGDAQNDAGIQRITGYAPLSLDYASLVNDGVRRMMRRGDFAGTVVPIFVGAYNGFVAWPRYVLSVRKVNVANRPVPVENLWWQFMERGQGCAWQSWLGWDCTSSVQQFGKACVLQDIQGDGRYIRVSPRSIADVNLGRTITFYGVDNNNQPLQTLQPDGTYAMGLTLTLAMPYVQSTIFVRRIDRVLKPQTSGILDVYAFNSATSLLEEIAHYEGSETSPEYSKVFLQNVFPAGCIPAGATLGLDGLIGVLALVKLKHIPAVNPSDYLPVDNLDALKLEIQSIKLMEAGDIQGSLATRMQSTKELNLQLADESPDDQFAAAQNTFGRGRAFRNQCF